MKNIKREQTKITFKINLKYACLLNCCATKNPYSYRTKNSSFVIEAAKENTKIIPQRIILK